MLRVNTRLMDFSSFASHVAASGLYLTVHVWFCVSLIVRTLSDKPVVYCRRPYGLCAVIRNTVGGADGSILVIRTLAVEQSIRMVYKFRSFQLTGLSLLLTAQQIDTKPKLQNGGERGIRYACLSHVCAGCQSKIKRTKRSARDLSTNATHHLVSAVRLDHTESKMSRHEYTLHYHGGIPGRGEFVRLAFEYTGTPYRVRFPSSPTSDLLTSLCSTG